MRLLDGKDDIELEARVIGALRQVGKGTLLASEDERARSAFASARERALSTLDAGVQDEEWAAEFERSVMEIELALADIARAADDADTAHAYVDSVAARLERLSESDRSVPNEATLRDEVAARR